MCKNFPPGPSPTRAQRVLVVGWRVLSTSVHTPATLKNVTASGRECSYRYVCRSETACLSCLCISTLPLSTTTCMSHTHSVARARARRHARNARPIKVRCVRQCVSRLLGFLGGRQEGHRVDGVQRTAICARGIKRRWRAAPRQLRGARGSDLASRPR